MMEIERKFLVKESLLPPLSEGRYLAQGYLSFGPPTVRIRLVTAADGNKTGYLTVKGEGHLSREEYEYPVPGAEAEQLLRLSLGSIVVKKRYLLPVSEEPQLKWELDIFEGENSGLVVAEIELPSVDYPFASPEWLGLEVTEEPAYKNSALALHPFKAWKK